MLIKTSTLRPCFCFNPELYMIVIADDAENGFSFFAVVMYFVLNVYACFCKWLTIVYSEFDFKSVSGW